MNDLVDSLQAHGKADLVSIGEQTVLAAAVLERAAMLERAMGSVGGRTILSFDMSPVTLLALLAIAESHPCQLILGRSSVDISTLGDTLQPDIVVQSTGQIEKQGERIAAGRQLIPGIMLLTSGTTGIPKMVHQTLPALLGRVRTGSLDKNRGARWLLTYEPHSFAGLQVVLSAALSGGLLICPEGRSLKELAHVARSRNVTHISGTPTFWRALLMAIKDDGLPSLRQITLGGEAIDQATLDRLSYAFPGARVSHIYASTEAGSLFAVHDRRAGFPSAWLGQELPGGVALRVRDGMLEVRSPRSMVAYASGQQVPLTQDGWLGTGDLVHMESDRILFDGRQDQIVNIGGLKVSPVEIEAFLLAQPMVSEAQVYGVPSPLTGALLAARILMNPGLDPKIALDDLRAACASGLARYKMPRRFELVDAIATSSSGKKVQPL